MTYNVRTIQSVHGPAAGSDASRFGTSGEYSLYNTYVLNASQSVSVNGTSEQIAYVVPGLSAFALDGANQDALPSSGNIGTVSAVRLACMGVALAANTANLTLSFFLRRAGNVVGGGAFAGWASASNAAIGAFQQVLVPFLPTNTALVLPYNQSVLSATNALLPVQPGDILTFSVATAGAVTVPFMCCFIDVV